MELLNGKAKELFDEWRMTDKALETYGTVYFYDLPKELQCTMIIECFDSVNIAIIIRPKNIKSWDYEVHDFKNIDYVFDCEFESRKQAAVEAIKKAVELINESNGK